MTSEDMEKAIQFILDQQAKAEVRQAEYEARHIREVEELRSMGRIIQENQQALADTVTRLTLQSEQDHNQIVTAHNQLSASVTAVNTALIRLEVIVERDKEETKARLDRLEAQAEKDRQLVVNAVEKLTNSISNVHRRVSHLEDQNT